MELLETHGSSNADSNIRQLCAGGRAVSPSQDFATGRNGLAT